MRIPLALGAMVAIVGSAGYFIVRQIHAATPPEAASASTEPGRGAEGVPARTEAPPAIAEQSAPTPVSAIQAASAGAPDRDVATSAVAKPKNVARSAKAPPIFVGPPAPEPHPEPAPVVMAAAPPPPAQRPPDRMQLLAQAFAQCPQDSVIPRMLCEQKARLQYCDGYWGQTPMCPDGAPPSYYSR